jgi:hypothetical protein
LILPPDRYASDPHRLEVYPSAPPYAGRISVQVVSTVTGQTLPLPDGSDRVVLDALITVRGRGPAVERPLDYRLGNAVELWCSSVEQQGETLHLSLYWHVRKPPGEDLVVFVHGLDAQGNLIAQNDAPPLEGFYPATLWRDGQNLEDRHTLPADPAIVSIGVGLHTLASPQRLPVTRHGEPVANDYIVLPAAPAACRK